MIAVSSRRVSLGPMCLIGFRKSIVDTVQNHLRNFFAILRQYRGVVSRERVDLESIPGNAGPTKVSVIRWLDR